MNSPSCQATLQMTDRAGVEIDYCPTCRGVWLDKGELDKIIERSHAHLDGQHAPPGADYPPDGQPRQERRESWFEQIFDFFD